MTSAFLWLVLMSGLAMISVFLRLLLMAVEAVERATGGRSSWYSWSVKSDSGTSTAILRGDELCTGTWNYCYICYVEKLCWYHFYSLQMCCTLSDVFIVIEVSDKVSGSKLQLIISQIPKKCIGKCQIKVMSQTKTAQHTVHTESTKLLYVPGGSNWTTKYIFLTSFYL